jgi:hypothetical protein
VFYSFPLQFPLHVSMSCVSFGIFHPFYPDLIKERNQRSLDYSVPLL